MPDEVTKIIALKVLNKAKEDNQVKFVDVLQIYIDYADESDFLLKKNYTVAKVTISE